MIEQGTNEWYVSRMGRVTASEVYFLYDTKAARDTYIKKLKKETEQKEEAAEHYAEIALSVNSAAITHGRIMEDRARAAYEIITSNDVSLVGFKMCDYNILGASVDGLVGDYGMIEIKCPLRVEVHDVTCIYGMPSKHKYQVQAGMYVMNRDWCDFVSYHQNATINRLHVQRILRNKRLIKSIVKKATEVNNILIGDRHE